MYPRIALLLLVLHPALWTPRAAGGDTPVHTDRYGDPLPPEVIARLGSQRLTLFGVRFLAFSPDGRLLAAHDDEDNLRVWDVNSGKVLFQLTTPSYVLFGTEIRPLAFSPDSKAIALVWPKDKKSGPNRKAMVRIWEVATGKELHCFGDLVGWGLSLVFSPDGRYLFAADGDAPILRWDLTGGGTPKKYSNSEAVTCLAISRDGKTLTAETRNRQNRQERTFVRWDTATGKEMGRHTLTTTGGWDGRISPEGSVFAAAATDGKSIALLDSLTGRERSRVSESDFPSLIRFSADGTAMTCTSREGTVRVWDTATGKVRARFKSRSKNIENIALSCDGKRVALTGRADHAVHVWDVAAGRELHSFAGHRGGPLTIVFLNDGKEIATVSRDNVHSIPIDTWADWSLRRWDATTGAERAVTRANPNGEVWHTSFSADGRRLATVIHDGTLHLWDVESGKELRSWKVPTQPFLSILKDDKGGKKAIKTPFPQITQPVFSADGKMLLAARGPNIVRWETATGRELPAFETRETSPWEYPWCILAPDGKTLAVCRRVDPNAQVVLLDATNGKVKQRLRNIRVGTGQPTFSPDGRTIAVEEIGAISLWEVASGRPRGRLREPRMAFGLAFSPDGRFLAVGTDPATPMNLWDLATGQVAGQLPNDLGRVQSLVFSPDGSRLAVAGSSPTVLVCDVAELCGRKKIAELAKTADPSAERLEGLWAELSSGDGALAYRAICQLARIGPRGVALLKARLKGDKPPDERRIARLIADLNDNDFATRDQASTELAKLGARAEPALRRALKGEVSAEVRVRIKRLLEHFDAPQGALPSLELIRLRTVEALEANGSKEARQVLAELADGPADATLTQEAKASLTRLRARRVQP